MIPLLALSAMDRSNENSISLNKYISSTGVCSRREANKWIAEGRVTINGDVGILGNRVFEGDEVKIDGKAIKAHPDPIYIAFNKPVGIVCTTDIKEPDNIISYINHPQRLFPIGRLDKPSEGLIFLTNDGDIVNKILRAGNKHEKEYIVSVSQQVTSDFLKKMRSGVPILGTMTKKCSVYKVDNFTFKIILTEGMNRQIRRMCEHLDYEVTALKRVRIMSIELGKLKPGIWRPLTPNEIRDINQNTEASIKTEEASTRSKIGSFKRKQ